MLILYSIFEKSNRFEDIIPRCLTVVRRWEFQLCPKCFNVVRQAEECQHMMCPTCLTSFCGVCRKRKIDCENSNLIGSCANLKKRYHKEDFGHVPLYILILCLLGGIVLSPFLALFLVPYIVMMNAKEYFSRPKYRVIYLNDSSVLLSSNMEALPPPTFTLQNNVITNIPPVNSSFTLQKILVADPPSLCLYPLVILLGVFCVTLFPLSTLGVIIAFFILFFSFY